jgi:methionyl-tRNA synthetase
MNDFWQAARSALMRLTIGGWDTSAGPGPGWDEKTLEQAINRGEAAESAATVRCVETEAVVEAARAFINAHAAYRDALRRDWRLADETNARQAAAIKPLAAALAALAAAQPAPETPE